MGDDFYANLTCFTFSFLMPSTLALGITIGAMIERPRERDKTVIYCIDNPDQCKIEYTYLKLKETQNEN